MHPYIEYIKSVIDKALQFSEIHLMGLQQPIYFVPNEMIDKSKTSQYPEIVFWKPILANIEIEQFDEYERRIGFTLPEAYKIFLSYKYFVDLNFGHSLRFFRHTYEWQNDYYQNILWLDVNETLKKGLIPFAFNNDRGCFCFDTNAPNDNFDYKIVDYNPEFNESECPSIVNQYTFIDLVAELENSLEKWKKRKLNN